MEHTSRRGRGGVHSRRGACIQWNKEKRWRVPDNVRKRVHGKEEDWAQKRNWQKRSWQRRKQQKRSWLNRSWLRRSWLRRQGHCLPRPRQATGLGYHSDSSLMAGTYWQRKPDGSLENDSRSVLTQPGRRNVPALSKFPRALGKDASKLTSPPTTCS